MESVAKSNLRKAGAFLSGSQLSYSSGNYDSAVVLASIAAIKAKDAIAIYLTGKSRKSKNHIDAVSELKSLPNIPHEAVRAFRELISRKSDTHYGSEVISRSRAERDLENAKYLVSFAQQLLENYG